MMLLALRAAGLDPVNVSSGADALKALDTTQVDLPGDLGSLVLDRLREASGPSRTPIRWVVVSAQDIERVTALYGPIGDRFLAKPFDPWDLVGILRALYD